MACPETSSLPMILSLGGEGTETSPLGYSYHPITGEWKGHTGVDFWGLMQERRFLLPLMGLWLMQDGSVWGWNACILDHGEGITTLYGHMLDGSPMAATGDTVVQGYQIGEVGSTGNSTGPHFHFEVRIKGTPTLLIHQYSVRI